MRGLQDFTTLDLPMLCVSALDYGRVEVSTTLNFEMSEITSTTIARGSLATKSVSTK